MAGGVITENTKVKVTLARVLGVVVILFIGAGGYLLHAQEKVDLRQDAEIGQKVNTVRYDKDQDRLWKRLDDIYKAVK